MPGDVTFLHGPAAVNDAARRAEALTVAFQQAELAAMGGLLDIVRPWLREGEEVTAAIGRMPEPVRSAAWALWDAVTAAP